MRKISIIICGALLILLFGYYWFNQNSVNSDNQIGCTMEAMICPDGSAVGRSGPKCEFSPCP